LARRAAEAQAAGAALSARDLAVDGTTLMKELGLRPSKQLGTLLAALLARAVDDPSVNTREGLLAIARELSPAG